MVYIVSIMKEQYGTDYRLFETNTETFFNCNGAELKKLMVETNINIKNASIISGEIVENTWCSKINRGGDLKFTSSDYILICKIDKNKFKLINNEKDIIYVDTKQLYRHAKHSRIYNCSIEAEIINAIDTYSINKDTHFEENIAKKYENYTAKTALLGRKMSFDYIIEGQEVKLRKYTGATKNVIVPSFITSIMENAFYLCKIDILTLDEGLKYIGGYAFNGCKLAEVTIPKTVEFIGRGAFYGNKRLVEIGGEYTDKIKLLTENVVTIKDRY